MSGQRRVFPRDRGILAAVLVLTLGVLVACGGKSEAPVASSSPPSRYLPMHTPSPTPTFLTAITPPHVRAAPVHLLAPVGPSVEEVHLSATLGPSAVPVSYRKGEYGVPPLPQVITYTVRPGDTVSSIALRFGISMDALRWSNPSIEYNPDDLYPGDVLRIPPVNGVVVEVKKGDTVESLARRYHVPPDVIRTYAANRLRPPYTLKPGQWVVIPGGHKEINVQPPRAYPGYAYMWPARGIITQHFHAHHHGLDIAGPYGSYVYAARSGRVRTVRWDDTGYGYMVIIDHGDGWNTLYAHLKGALVHPGQWVRQGDVIGRMGGTGRATGPHVHFEIRKGRVRYDPEKFLPPSP